MDNVLSALSKKKLKMTGKKKYSSALGNFVKVFFLPEI